MDLAEGRDGPSSSSALSQNGTLPGGKTNRLGVCSASHSRDTVKGLSGEDDAVVFAKCPECGETNHYESLSTRIFDCGFRSSYDARTSPCRAKNRRAAAGPYPSPPRSGATASHCSTPPRVAETIAADMTAEGQDSEFVERCADLARQMREFAGHTPGQDTLGGGQSGAGNTGTALTRFLRKGWPR